MVTKRCFVDLSPIYDLMMVECNMCDREQVKELTAPLLTDYMSATFCNSPIKPVITTDRRITDIFQSVLTHAVNDAIFSCQMDSFGQLSISGKLIDEEIMVLHVSTVT